jgi:hypothetical protein
VEEPLRYQAITGLTRGQLAELSARVAGVIGDVAAPGGRPPAIGLFRSVAMVVALLRHNLTQDVAGAFFGVSQPTVSRRWDLLRPAIGAALAGCVPDPREILGNGSALVDGTVAPTWDWKAIPDLYSGKAGYAGMNIQLAAALDGRIAAIGPAPVHGARHDAHAYQASGLKDLLTSVDTAADLGYTGVDGIRIVPFRTPPGGQLDDSQAAFNTALSKIRAAVEHAIAHLKTWRMLSEEGGRYRPPIGKHASMLRAIIGLFFFTTYE